MRILTGMFAMMLAACLAPAQTQVRTVPSTPADADAQGSVPIYRVTVTGRTTKAINYRYRRGMTKIDFRGTPLMPMATGEANVQSNQGSTKIDINVHHLTPATQFGPEYLTYVLWAVTPNGRPENLGEIVLSGDHSDLHAATELAAFGLIVTAEPYFAVTQPSDLVVMENFIRPETVGTIESVDAKYDLLKKGEYIRGVPPSDVVPLNTRGDLLQVWEAQNAMRIARWAGADKYAGDMMAKANTDMQNATAFMSHDRKEAAMIARHATQTAEDARLVSLRRQRAEAEAAEKQAAADAQEAANRRAQEEGARADAARLQADQAARDRAEAEARQRAEAEHAAKAEADREKAEADRQAALAQQQAAQAQAAAEAEKARQAADEAAKAREELRLQLNSILETRETARGLIATMSDVLFDTGKWTLKPGAREKLAKVAGILIAHPGIQIQVEGHTDNVGGEEFNQRLSEHRAEAVRDYLVGQGVSQNVITAEGFGKTRPVASNDNAAGRQLNRRVEMVVSGEGLGQPGVSSKR